MKIKRKPEWLKIQLPKGDDYAYVNGIVQEHGLHTICSSGKCPNVGECWGNGTATFMILGNICTRACKFCNVPTGKPLPVDTKEPKRLARSIKLMKLKHAVITSVDRDDLEDGGSGIWAECIKEIKETCPGTSLEVLIPDFNGKEEDVQRVINENPEVISHNLETVRRLTPEVRSRAKYDLSLKVLKQIADSGIVAKSGIMLGLGETEEEIYQTMDDLLAVGVKVMTIGQYLQPTRKHLELQEYITPEQFKKYEQVGLEKGFSFVESTPLVRSSYHAEQHVNALKLKQVLKND
ncbi:lipoyl synthase [Marinifilum sp. D737]|jgi:lipoic acid synthetase|uniref:lipoyl synthase n=1 Tax=Marinifilum sp. D737 TaxID=2969628 RepID=UPI0022752E29|nr:lipoyl synthase [Marinifilum sp. D737]MCY1632809.1 lipoyl synthase [Marinifilum sp. D737]